MIQEIIQAGKSMKNPWLAGILNLIIPGLGMVYLRKWATAVVYFL
jgi:hypothetical protein